MIINGDEAQKLLEFFRESNAIENVFDDESIDQQMHAWKYLLYQKELTAHNIKKTQKILMNNQPLRPNCRGYWRPYDVRVGERVCPPYKAVPKLIDDWLPRANYVYEMSKQSPSTVEGYIEDLHIEFEGIHPFADGNGRVGRMIWQWHRVQAGLPLLVIKASERAEYYKWFSGLLSFSD